LGKAFVANPEEVEPENNIIAVYWLESSRGSLLDAAKALASEQSIGTWTEVKTETLWIRERLSAKVFKWKGEKEGLVSVAFPLELFDLERGGIPCILGITAGNLFGLSEIKNARLIDLQIPKSAVKIFPGPKFGIEGIRKICGTVKNRIPHIGTIFKPKVGLKPKEMADIAYEVGVGGVNFCKDDETLFSQKFCPIEERVSLMMEALDKVYEETGRRVMYAVNVTAATPRLIYENIESALDNGANAIMLDILLAGFGILHQLAEDPSIKVPIHCHRAFHAAFTRNPRHGVHMIIVAKLTRLAGGDQLHTGTAAGKMGLSNEVREIQLINDFLRNEWYSLKTVFPVASGGIHPALVPINVRLLGRDIVINAGGGIHGHPMGSRAGAKAMAQAVEATLKNIPLEEYAKTHIELKAALEKWGYKYAEKASEFLKK